MRRFKLLFFALLLLSTSNVHAQIIFQEDFQGGIPGTWTLINNDGLTPASAVSYVTNAWVAREDFVTPVNSDTAAVSTSWYSPAGQADDWLITPQITLTSNNILSWEALAPDNAYPDGYEVRISTTTPTIAGFTANAPLLTVSAENDSWTQRQVNLQTAGYANQNVYIAFRNNSNDMFLLFVDSVTVSVGANYDAKMAAVNSNEYTMIPVTQSPTLNFSGDIANTGLDTVTNVTLDVTVFDGSMTSVYSASSTPQAMLAPGDTTTLTVAGYTPSAADAYTIRYIASITETDATPANDTMWRSIVISDSTFARDNGNITGSLGIGAGNGGFLGQEFVLTSPEQLSSVFFVLANNNDVMAGQPVNALILDYNNGMPGNIIGSTDTVVVDTTTPFVANLMIAGGPLSLPADTFVIVIEERDSNVTVATTSGIFTEGTTWVNWPTSPLGGWGNNEDFGFFSPYVIRANFNANCAGFTGTITGYDATCQACTDGAAVVNMTGGTAPYNYTWSNSASTDSVSGLTPGTYSVVVTDQNGCVFTDSVTISFPVGIAEETLLSGVQVYPNPNNGQFTVSGEFAAKQQVSISVMNTLGQTVYQSEMNVQTINEQISLNLESGVYFVRIKVGKETRTEKMIVK